MDKTPEIKIHLNRPDARHFYRLLSKGFRISFDPGCTIKDLLCNGLGINETYVEERIQTIFLNGKAVDDIQHAVVTDGSTLALSAAMPGLAGAVFRSGGRYSAMRASISYTGREQEPHSESGVFNLKLFNLVAREIGDAFLHRGILTDGQDVSDILKNHRDIFSHEDNTIWVDQHKTDVPGLLSSGIKTGDVFLKIRFRGNETP